MRGVTGGMGTAISVAELAPFCFALVRVGFAGEAALIRSFKDAKASGSGFGVMEKALSASGSLRGRGSGCFGPGKQITAGG